MKTQMDIKSTRLWFGTFGIIMIVVLTIFIQNNNVAIAIGTIGTITTAYIGVKSYTDGKKYQYNNSAKYDGDF